MRNDLRRSFLLRFVGFPRFNEIGHFPEARRDASGHRGVTRNVRLIFLRGLSAAAAHRQVHTAAGGKAETLRLPC